MADSKLVTHSLVESMNEPGSRIPFVSRCPSNFEGKLAERCILRAYKKDSWEEFGTFQEGKKAASYRGQCFHEEVCGAPVRLLVLESSALKEKAAAALEKSRDMLKPEIKKYLGLGNGAFTHWKYDNHKSFLIHIIKMAEFLGVTPNYLLSGRDEDINVDTMSASEIKLVRLYRQMQFGQKECLMRTATLFANALEEERNTKK